MDRAIDLESASDCISPPENVRPRGGGGGSAREMQSAAREIARSSVGAVKGSAMKMASKPNPNHQKTDMVSSTGRMAYGPMYVVAPQSRTRAARLKGR